LPAVSTQYAAKRLRVSGWLQTNPSDNHFLLVKVFDIAATLQKAGGPPISACTDGAAASMARQ